jgi:ribonucleoside-diphosphate reductase beta chain
VQFAEDLLRAGRLPGMSPPTCASTWSTWPTSGCAARHPRRSTARKNPFAFMELQDVQELSNFFERRVSAYQVAVTRLYGVGCRSILRRRVLRP